METENSRREESFLSMFYKGKSMPVCLRGGRWQGRGSFDESTGGRMKTSKAKMASLRRNWSQAVTDGVERSGQPGHAACSGVFESGLSEVANWGGLHMETSHAVQHAHRPAGAIGGERRECGRPHGRRRSPGKPVVCWQNMRARWAALLSAR